MTSRTRAPEPLGQVSLPRVEYVRPEPSYGELFATARSRVAEACTHGSGPFASPTAALTAAVNFERVLAVGGHHLRLLTVHPQTIEPRGPGHAVAPLVDRLTGLAHHAGGDDLWGRAATQLAAAHDLLATHIGPAGERRTPEAHVLHDPAVRTGAVARVLELLRTAVNRGDELLAYAADANRAHPGVPGLDRSRATRLRQATRAARDLLAGLPDGGPLRSPHLDELDGLTPAPPRLSSRSTATGLDTNLAALRVLRLLSHRQTTGSDHASPASLLDLTKLAVAANRAATSWLPEPSTPLARVQTAVASEQLHDAERAWRAAQTALGSQVHGLTKAPRVYADAVRATVAALPHDQALGTAVLTALPRLGRDAGSTVRLLSSTGALVVASRQAARSQPSWRRLSAEETEQIATAFCDAGGASQRARSTYLHAASRGVATPPPSVPEQVRRRVLTAEGRSR